MTATIPIKALGTLNVHKGDTLLVLDVVDDSLLLTVNHNASISRKGQARAWLKSARGIVELAPGESPDDLRIEYYAKKYGQ